MKVGDYLSVKGPKGRFKYQVGQVRAFGMLAGGSGITPMFQVTIKPEFYIVIDHATKHF